MKPCYLLHLEYNGKNFCGWQRQCKALGIQEVVENALANITGESVTIYAAGRTDKGVHALGQCVHFYSSKALSLNTWRQGLNHYLKAYDVCVMGVWLMNQCFHARFSAVSRRYVYKIFLQKTALYKDYVWCVPYALDMRLLEQAVEVFQGTHDFSSFRSFQCQSASPVKTLDFSALTRQENTLFLWFQARSFLHHQVRMIVGTCIEVARGHWPIEKIFTLLNQPDLVHKGVTAPPYGLYFLGPSYYNSDFISDVSLQDLWYPVVQDGTKFPIKSD